MRLDDFLVTLALADGTQRTFRRERRRARRSRSPIRSQGHRALLGGLTDKDMHDVTAYLVTLK